MPPRPPQSPTSSSSSSSPIQPAIASAVTNKNSLSSSSPGKPSIAHMIELSSEMTSNQRKRFMYFQQQRAFVKKLAEICEKLRYLEKEVCIRDHSFPYSSLLIPLFTDTTSHSSSNIHLLIPLQCIF